LTRKILTSVALVPVAGWAPQRVWALWKGERTMSVDLAFRTRVKSISLFGWTGLFMVIPCIVV